jgi:hypothetical protein
VWEFRLRRRRTGLGDGCRRFLLWRRWRSFGQQWQLVSVARQLGEFGSDRLVLEFQDRWEFEQQNRIEQDR